jgi:hypothetical protein
MKTKTIPNESLKIFLGPRAAGFPERSERGREDENRRKESPAETLPFAAAIFPGRDLSRSLDPIRHEPAGKIGEAAR